VIGRVRTAALLAALLVAAPALAAADDALPVAAELRAHVRAAEHTPPGYRETIVTTSSDGTTTTEHRVVRGEDEHDVEDSGAFHDEGGSIEGRRWRQTANGISLDDRADPGHALPEPMTTSVARIHAPVDGYVIATLNTKGWGRKEYVDGSGWYVVRREKSDAGGVVTTIYDEIRNDHGRIFAHHWAATDSITQTTSESRVTDYAPAVVSDDELARPPSRRTLVEFPTGAASVDLPVHFGGHVYATVTIGGTDYQFVLDTGASGIAVDSGVARALGLTLYGEHAHLVAGRTTVARSVVPEMRIGTLVMRDVAVGVVPLGSADRRGVRMAGLLGFDFLAQLGVTIDYEQSRVSVVPSAAFRAPAGPPAFALAARLGRGVPMVSVALDGMLAERFVLDTGGVGNFLVFDYFMRRNPNAFRETADAFPFARNPRLSGVGGAFSVTPAFVHQLTLGEAHVADLLGYRVASEQAYTHDLDGVIGDGILRYFTLALDYAGERVYLTPNSAGRKLLGL
jgi:clan AA aspartic protease (TIGR02281 family)